MIGHFSWHISRCGAKGAKTEASAAGARAREQIKRG